MTQSNTMKRLETKVYTSFHDDGIIDIFAGLLLAVDGILMLTNNSAFVGVAAILIFLIFPMKNIVTVPRIGMVKFSSNRRERLSKTYILTLVLGLAVLFFFVISRAGTGTMEWVRQYYDLVFALLFMVTAGVGAYLTNQKRFIVYTGLILVIFAVGHVAKWDLPISLIITGAMLTVTGLAYLTKFLREHPKPKSTN